MLVLREVEHAERDVLGFGFGFLRLVTEQIPLLLRGAIEERPRMTGIAYGQAATGSEKSGYNRGGESSGPRHAGKLLIEQADKLGLIEAVHEATHEGAKIRSCGSDGISMAGNVREKQASDASGGATGCVVNVSTALGFAVRLAKDPGFQAAKLHAARGELAASPDLHALHVFCGRVTHDGAYQPKVASFYRGVGVPVRRRWRLRWTCGEAWPFLAFAPEVRVRHEPNLRRGCRAHHDAREKCDRREGRSLRARAI